MMQVLAIIVCLAAAFPDAHAQTAADVAKYSGPDRAQKLMGPINEVARLGAMWQLWADRVGVIDWNKLPGSDYRPSVTYRKKSEPLAR